MSGLNPDSVPFIPGLVCSSCKKGKLDLKEVDRISLAPVCSSVCQHCSFTSELTLASKNDCIKFYDINRPSALAMRMIGSS